MSTTYRYGLAGIGSNVQIGRRGGHFDWFNASSVYRFYEADNATLANVRVSATPINANDAVSKTYVDSLVAGLSPKDTVRVASTAPLALASDFENGDTVDGVVLVTGNRILIKDQAAATENGIYTVNATGAPTRSTDADSSTDLAAAFVFVQEGTAHANEGWVTSFNDSDTIGVDPITWSKFSSAGLNTASNGIKLVGADIQMDITTLTGATAVVAADEMAFYDVSGGAHLKRTWTDIISDLNITTSGALAGGIGIDITTGTITFDNSGMADTAVVGTDAVPFFDASNADQAEFRTWAGIISDLSIITVGNVAASLTGGVGIDITGSTFTFDNSGMADTAVVGADTIPFFDTSAANQAEFRSWTNILSDLDIKTGTVGVTSGGTGLTTIPQYSLLVANAADTLVAITATDTGGNQLVQWNDTTNTFEFITTASVTGADSFATIDMTAGNTAGDAIVVADTPGDTLNLLGGDGILLTGIAVSDTVTVSLSLAGLADTAVVGTDAVPFFDASNANAPEFRTWASIITDLNITTSGVLIGGTGIDITTGTITFDNSGMVDTAVVGTDTVPFFDTSAANQAEFRSWANILADLNVVNNIAVNGFVVQTAPDTYVGRTVVASVTASEEGIVVVNGDGVAGNPTVGLDINGLIADTATVATDEFVYFNGVNNVKIDRDSLASELMGVSHGIRVMEVAFGAANTPFAVTLPDTARVQRVRVVIDTIDAAADVSVTSAANTIFATTSVDANLAGTYEDETDYRNTSGVAETVTVVVATATVVAGRCYIEYYQNSAV